MSKYYIPLKTKGLYSPDNKEPFKLSRSKIDLFLECARCFYLDRRLGVGRPPSFPFTLNSAVDKLLKKEFDIHRTAGNPHPLMAAYGLDAIPFAHKDLDAWRDSLGGGIRYYDKASNFLFYGGVDDVWQSSNGDLIIVDYKSTAKDGEVSLDADWQISYKRQMEVYQWLFRKNGFSVASTGFFVYCNGETDKEAFDAKLEFTIKIIPYKGDDSWISDALLAAKKCLDTDSVPKASRECNYCNFRHAANEVEKSVSASTVSAPKKNSPRSLF